MSHQCFAACIAELTLLSQSCPIHVTTHFKWGSLHYLRHIITLEASKVCLSALLGSTAKLQVVQRLFCRYPAMPQKMPQMVEAVHFQVLIIASDTAMVEAAVAVDRFNLQSATTCKAECMLRLDQTLTANVCNYKFAPAEGPEISPRALDNSL